MRFIKFASIADWLDAAADYIEKNGWWRGSLYGPNKNQACSIGAILRAGNLDTSAQDAKEVREVCAVLMIAVNGRPLKDSMYATNEVASWNDDTANGARDRQDVLDMFRKAAKIDRAGFDPDAA